MAAGALDEGVACCAAELVAPVGDSLSVGANEAAAGEFSTVARNVPEAVTGEADPLTNASPAEVGFALAATARTITSTTAIPKAANH